MSTSAKRKLRTTASSRPSTRPVTTTSAATSTVTTMALRMSGV